MSIETFPDGDPAFDTSVAHHARVYNYLLGGKDHFAADRALADALMAVYRGTVATARVNRDFLGRVVRFLASEGGVSQFLDIGTGIPGSCSTHEVAQEAGSGSRIVYVDHDPVVLAHARALLVGREPGTTDYIDADLRDPDLILDQAAWTLDLSKPVGLLLIALLHAIPDSDDPCRIVATLLNALPGGSYLAITHWTMDLLGPGTEKQFAELNSDMSHHQYTARTKTEVARFFDGLDLVEPGIVSPQDWRPDPRKEAADTAIGSRRALLRAESPTQTPLRRTALRSTDAPTLIPVGLGVRGRRRPRASILEVRKLGESLEEAALPGKRRPRAYC